MIIKLLIIILAAGMVFWLIKRALPALRAGKHRKFIPLLLSPMAFSILRRVVPILLRFIFRR